MATTELSFQSLADQFLEDFRAGRCKSVEQFAAAHPEMAELIRDEFPGIILAERMRSPNPQANAEPEVPVRIGRYVVQGEIGKGGMGRVFAARHSELDRDVAIKVLSLKSMRSPGMLERFHVEARASAMLNHQNIVPVYDHGIEDQFAYIVMRRIVGIGLDRLAARVVTEKRDAALAMDWNLVAGIGAQVASALSYAHEQGIVHRDIKPANLILEKSGRVWITDFGLAKILVRDLELSTAGDLIGTPKYMAPEQFRGICDPRSDIYGLGLTLFELASGQPIWDSITANELIHHRSSLELPDLKVLNPAIPDAVGNIIMKACEFRPEDRYQTARELSYVLNRYAHGNPVGDRRRSSQNPRSKWKRKTWMLSYVAAFFGSIALATGALQYTAPKPYQDKESALRVLRDDDVREEFVEHLPGLIEEMARDNDPRFRSAMGTLTQQAIEQAMNRYDISSEDKSEVERKVDGWVESYKSGDLTNGDISKIWTGIAQSPVASVVRFQPLQDIVQDSQLSSGEKNAAWLLMNRLHLGIVDGRISNGQSGTLVDGLERLIANRKVAVINGVRKEQVDDTELRVYLTEMYHTVNAAGIPEDGGQLRAASTISQAVEGALSDPQLAKWVQEQTEVRNRIREAQKAN